MSEVSNRRFVHFDGTKQEFIDGGYPDQYQESIVFINENGKESINTIYTHGEYYGQGVIVEGDASNSAVLKGSGNTASKSYSMAVGKDCTASGAYSTAIGYSNTASGTCSYAEGYGKASILDHFTTEEIDVYTDYSAEKFKETKDKIYNKYKSLIDDTLADPGENLFSVAFAIGSHIEGRNGMALDERAHVEGLDNIAYGINSHAENSRNEAYGNNSHAEGNHTTAKGNMSHAEGSASVAEGGASHAEGSTTHAKGPRSHAEGYHTYAGSQSSHAEGFDSSAIASYSHSEGYKTIAEGSSSHAEGYCTHAKGLSSHTSGFYTKTTKDYEFACGKYNESKDNTLFSVGYGDDDSSRYNVIECTTDNNLFVKNKIYQNDTDVVASDKDVAIKIIENHCAVLVDSSNTVSKDYPRSVAMGYNGESKGETSFSEGYETRAIGHNSHAKGERTLAQGQSSSAEGVNTIAYGKGSHAEGYSSKKPNEITKNDGSTYLDVWDGNFLVAEGNYSHAEGYSVVANGNYSHAEGRRTIAKGTASHAEGLGNEANSSEYGAFANYSHVEGGYNVCADGAVYGHAEGTKNITNGRASHAEGGFNIASGEMSHVEGYGNLLGGNYSHVEGSNNESNGNCNHIEGGSNLINGCNYAHVGGYMSTSHVGSDCAFVHGYKLKVNNPQEVAFGQFNNSQSENEHYTLFSVGTGDERYLHNGLEIYKSNEHDGVSMNEDGNVVITKCDLLETSLRIINKIDIRSTGGSRLYISTSYANLLPFEIVVKIGFSDGTTQNYTIIYNTIERFLYYETSYSSVAEEALDGYFTASGTRTLQTAYCYYKINI